MSDLPPPSSFSTSIPDPPPRIIRLRTSDGRLFKVTEAAASLSNTIKNLNEGCTSAVRCEIRFPNMTGPVMEKIKLYLEEHYAIAKGTSYSTAVGTTSSGVGSSSGSDESGNRLKAFDESFVREVSGDQAMLFDMIEAANCLDLKSLLDLLCKSVADMIRGKSTEEIRATFGVTNDFTPEEEEENRRKANLLLG